MTEHTRPRVDFYLLQHKQQNNVQRFCCRLADKAWKLNHTVFIQTENENETRKLDELMWTWSDQDFLPHSTNIEDAEINRSVFINHTPPANTTFDMLINLSRQQPEITNKFQRIAEILDDTTESLHVGRVHFKAYKKDGIVPQHHDIKS